MAPSDEYADPSGSTEQFRAFTSAVESPASARSPLVWGGAIFLALVAVAVVWLALG